MYSELVGSNDKKLQLVDRIIVSNIEEQSTKKKLEVLDIESLEQLIANMKGFEASYANTTSPLSVVALVFVLLTLVIQPIGLNTFTAIYLAVIAIAIILLFITITNQANVVKEAVIVRSILENILLEKRENTEENT